jgi:hypothetical protein
MTSPVSAVMLARIGPVKPFLAKFLTAHSDECGRAKDEPPTARCDAGAASAASPAAVKAYKCVSAVSAEIVGGTLPEKRFSPRILRRSVPVQPVRVGRETTRAAARRTGRPAG